MSYVTAISLLTTIALGFVVFGSPRASVGFWDDAAFLVSALVFLYGLVRLLGSRATEIAQTAADADQTPRAATPGQPDDSSDRRAR